MTPPQIAVDRNLPLPVVLEAIAYCESQPAEVDRDEALEEALLDARGINEPGFDGRLRTLSPEEKLAIIRKFD